MDFFNMMELGIKPNYPLIPIGMTVIKELAFLSGRNCNDNNTAT